MALWWKCSLPTGKAYPTVYGCHGSTPSHLCALHWNSPVHSVLPEALKPQTTVMDTQTQTIFWCLHWALQRQTSLLDWDASASSCCTFLDFRSKCYCQSCCYLLATILTAFSLLAHGAIAGQVYKLWYLNMIEYSYFLNLGVLACAIFYTRASGQEATLHHSGTTVHGQKVAVYTSVVIAIGTFIFIVMIHIVRKVTSFQPCNRLISETIILRLTKLRERVKLIVSRKHQCQCQSPPSPAHDENIAIQLRESLLEYCTDD